MLRREFLRRGALTASALSLQSFLARASDTAFELALQAPWALRAPWQIGYQGTEKNFAPLQMDIQGDWPKNLRGYFFRNGPALYTRNQRRYQHWFDGDGMIQQFKIMNGRVQHQGQFVATEKYLRESAAGEFLSSGLGTYFSDKPAARNNETGNVANTALLAWQNKLLALWEGGSAYEIDPENLQTLGKKIWRDDLSDCPFSAHPLRDADGTLWNFGSISFSAQPSLLIYQISAQGELLNLRHIQLPLASYLHAFTHTENYLLFYLSPCVFEMPNQAKDYRSFVDSFHWRPALGSKILVIEKNNLENQKWFDAEPGFIFHFAQSWQTRRSLFFSAAVYKNSDIMLYDMKKLVAGENNRGMEQAQLSVFEIELDAKKVTQHSTDAFLEFPSLDSVTQHQKQNLIGVQRLSNKDPIPMHRLITANYEKGVIDAYDFGSDCVVEEPLLIPKNAGTKENYVLMSFLNARKKQSGIALFDAAHLHRGPLAAASMERVIPLGFHGCFVPA